MFVHLKMAILKNVLGQLEPVSTARIIVLPQQHGAVSNSLLYWSYRLILHLPISTGYPYWTPSADKQYFVSKQCATKELCERTWNETLPYCERIWYLDWRCSECCQGDRCNYFVTVCIRNLQNYVSLLTIFFNFQLAASCSKLSFYLIAAGILTAIYRFIQACIANARDNCESATIPSLMQPFCPQCNDSVLLTNFF